MVVPSGIFNSFRDTRYSTPFYKGPFRSVFYIRILLAYDGDAFVLPISLVYRLNPPFSKREIVVGITLYLEKCTALINGKTTRISGLVSVGGFLFISSYDRKFDFFISRVESI